MNVPEILKRKGTFTLPVLFLLCVTAVSGVLLYVFTFYGATFNPWSLVAAVQPTKSRAPVALRFPEYDFKSPSTTVISVVRSQTVRFVHSDSQVQKVEFYKNNVLQAVTRAPLPSRFEWTISNLDNGRHSWMVKTFDQEGRAKVSQPIVFDVLVPAEQALPVVPVLSLRYIPDENGVVSFSTIPLGILDGVEGIPIAEAQDRISETEGLYYNAVQRGAIYHGFKNPYGVPAIQYRIIERKTVFSDPIVTSHPCAGQTCYEIDYVKMLNNAQVCDYVERLGVKQIWLWAPGSKIGSDETTASGPYHYSRAANGGRTIPLCGKTYALFTFNYGRDAAQALESYMHHLEAVFRMVDEVFFWDKFVGGWYWNGQTNQWPAGTGTVSNPRRCGWSHTPPQGNTEYGLAWFSDVPAVTNCGDWHPDGSGVLQEMTCHTYSNKASCHSSDPFLDAETGWKVYWMQNLPGKNNGISYQGRELRNWLDFVVDFDKAMQQGTDFFLPPAPPVTITKIGTGQGTISSNLSSLNCGTRRRVRYACRGTVTSGMTLSLTAAPALGSTFVGWQGGGACTGNARTIQFAVTASTTCTARFDRTTPTPVPITHSITVAKTGTGQGTVIDLSGLNCGSTCQSTFLPRTRFVLIAAPASGSTFVGWQGDGACTGSAHTLQFTGTADVTCIARFDRTTPVPTSRSVTITKIGTGQGTISSNLSSLNCGTACQGTVTSGMTLSLTAAPASGSTFVGWQGGGACTGSAHTLQFTGTADTTCAAQFDQIILTPTPVEGTCGSANNQCIKGTLSDTADTADTYRWSCLGLHGGTDAACSLSKPVTTPTYVCTDLPGNTNPYPAPDNTGLTSNTAYTHSGSDTSTIKCQFNCLSGYTWNESSKSCVANPVLAPGQFLRIISPVEGAYQIGQTVEVRYLADPSLASRPLKLELISFYNGNVLSTIVSSSCGTATYNCIWGNQTSYLWKVGANYPYPGKYRLRFSCVNGVGSTVACRDAKGLVIPPAVSEPLQIQNTTALAPTSPGTAAAADAPSQSLFDKFVGWVSGWF